MRKPRRNGVTAGVLGLLMLTGAGTVASAQPSPGATTQADDVIVDIRSPRIKASPGFQVQDSPFTRVGRYLIGQARNAAESAAVRFAAPEGEYFVYLTWVRHPQGARDVAVRLQNREVRIDQSRLANGRPPDEFERD
ncbi:MAG: hypothetical protein MUF25_27780, partial [Pirellulaceae bacterium]|nr:hypothetical protein [Pirellulaceae bacterium]